MGNPPVPFAAISGLFVTVARPRRSSDQSRRQRNRVGRRRIFTKQCAHLGTELIAVGAPDDLRIHEECDRGVGVPDLGLDVGDIEAGRKHERDVGPPECVGRDVSKDWRLVALGPKLVCSLQHWEDHAGPDVVLGSTSTRAGWERGRVHLSTAEGGAVGGKVVA